MSKSPLPLVIAGGGLAGGLAALALARSRPEVPLLLVEQGESFGGNHVWSYFDTDIEPADAVLLECLTPRHWPAHDIRFPARQRTLAIGYNSVSSQRLHEAVARTLRKDQLRLGSPIAVVDADSVTLAGGERIAASGVLDARGFTPPSYVKLGWQKFVGRTYRYVCPHGLERPIIMDATVDQSDGYRFVYSLPFSADELLIEDTYYSTSSQLDRDDLGAKLDRIAAEHGSVSELEHEEAGVLPVLLDGQAEAFWHGAEVARLGMAGGFFHPTTGYSLPDAVRNAGLLAKQTDFGSAALLAVFRREAERRWEERRFFALLNRMLFHAAEPADRYRVLEHFYRLPEPLIGRFYAGRLTAFDKARILSGRPPVRLHRALSALAGRAA